MTSIASAPDRPTRRFSQRRDHILDVASRHINQFGVRGMTLTRIARDLGIDTSSLTYYFRKREDLVVACLERSLAWQQGAAASAAAAADARGAVRSFLHAHFDVHRRVQPAGAPQLAYLGDMRSVSQERRSELVAHYVDCFRLIRQSLLSGGADRARAHIAAGVVMACAHWLSVWIGDYGEFDFDRVEARLFDALEHGLGGRHRWPAATLPRPPETVADAMLSRFLHAATDLINRDGYHGASVEKIAAELGVSTGSFYHHLGTKDELVLACFERHFTQIERTYAAAADQAPADGSRLPLIAAGLLQLQLGQGSQLMHASALRTLPPDLRANIVWRTGQTTRHLAGILSDDAARGHARAADPAIASQYFVSVINAAAGLRLWRPRGAVAVAPTLLAMLEYGIF